MSGDISHRPSTPFQSLKAGCNFPFPMGIMAKASRNPTADDALAAGKLIGLSRFRCLGRFRLAEKNSKIYHRPAHSYSSFRSACTTDRSEEEDGKLRSQRITDKEALFAPSWTTRLSMRQTLSLPILALISSRQSHSLFVSTCHRSHHSAQADQPLQDRKLSSCQHWKRKENQSKHNNHGFLKISEPTPNQSCSSI